MSITATVEKDTIKLPDGVHVPDGTRVQLEIATASASQWPADYFERTAGALRRIAELEISNWQTGER